MAFGVTATDVELAALAEQTYGSTLHRKANWSRIITSQFVEPETIEGAYGKQVNIGTVATAAVQTYTTGSTGDLSALTYEQDTEESWPITPARLYAALQLGPDVRKRFIRSEQFRKQKEQQLRAAIAAKVDETGATLASSLSNTVGGVGQDITEALLTSAIALLTNNAKEYYVPGKTKGYLYVHPMQVDDVLRQPNWSNAQVRGDGPSAVSTGWVNDAYNVTMTPSGNVYVSGGVAYNLFHVKGSHYLCWWEQINQMEPQKHGLDTFLICTGEHGEAEIDDDLGIAILTQNV